MFEVQTLPKNNALYSIKWTFFAVDEAHSMRISLKTAPARMTAGCPTAHPSAFDDSWYSHFFGEISIREQRENFEEKTFDEQFLLALFET